MPTLSATQAPLPPAQPPAVAGPCARLFALRPTGELFDDYGAYAARAALLRSPAWTCAATGRGGLTFEQAAASEARAAAAAGRDVGVAAPWHDAFLAAAVHWSPAPPDPAPLAARLSAATAGPAGRLCVGEPAALAACGTRVRVVRVPPGGLMGPGAAGDVYEVEEAESGPNPNNPNLPPGRRLTVRRDALARTAPPLTPAAAAAWLADCAACERLPPGPAGEDRWAWLVADEVAEGAGLAPGPPPPVAVRAVEAAATRRRSGSRPPGRPRGGVASASPTADGSPAGPLLPPSLGVPGLLATMRALLPPDGTPSEAAASAAAALARRAGRGTAAAALAIGGLTPAQTAALQAAVEAGETGVNADAGPGLPFPLPPTALAAPVELLADTAARLAPGTLKRAAFDCAFAAGPKGAAAADIVAAVQAAGVRSWDDMKAARASLASTLAHDPAFVRVAAGRFALRALLPEEQRAAAGSAALRAAAAAQAQEAAALAALAAGAATSGARPAKNVFKCVKCNKARYDGPEAGGGVLLLCDACPRAVHAGCIGVAGDLWTLPAGDWRCPRCEGATESAVKRLLDAEARKAGALQRVAAKAADVAAREAERGRRDAERAARDAARSARAAEAREVEDLDDLDVADGRASQAGAWGVDAAALRALAAEAKAGVAAGAAAGRLLTEAEVWARLEAARAAAEVAAPPPGLLPPPPASNTPTTLTWPPPPAPDAAPVAPTTLRAWADAAAAASARARDLAADPPLPASLPALESPAARRALADAAAVCAFGAALGTPLGLRPDLTPTVLGAAAARPLEAPSAGLLPDLYASLLSLLLVDMAATAPAAGEGAGPARARVRVWGRVLARNEAGTWPEVLRRYVAVSRAGVPFDPASAAATHPALLSDDAAALHAATLMAIRPWYSLPAALHLRLLAVLADDALDGSTARAELAARAEAGGGAVRVDALGADRHGRKYWWLPWCPDLVVVEGGGASGVGAGGAETGADPAPALGALAADSVAVLTSRLDVGPRERGLAAGLARALAGGARGALAINDEALEAASGALDVLGDTGASSLDDSSALGQAEEAAAVRAALEPVASAVARIGVLGWPADGGAAARAALEAAGDPPAAAASLRRLEAQLCRMGGGLQRAADQWMRPCLAGDRLGFSTPVPPTFQPGLPARAGPAEPGRLDAVPDDVTPPPAIDDAEAGALAAGGLVPPTLAASDSAAPPLRDPSARAPRVAAPLDDGDDSDDDSKLGSRARSALWRTARERCVWLREAARAGATGAGVAWCAAVLGHRAEVLAAWLERAAKREAAAAARLAPPAPAAAPTRGLVLKFSATVALPAKRRRTSTLATKDYVSLDCGDWSDGEDSGGRGSTPDNDDEPWRACAPRRAR